jgi:outer membrane protein TolC
LTRQTGTGTTTGSSTTTTPGGGTTTNTSVGNTGPDLNNESARVTVSQLIDITGIVKVAERYGDLQEALTRLELARIRQQTAYNVRNAYYNLLRAQAFVLVDQAAVNDSAELLRVTKAQQAVGVAAQFDVLTARTTLDNNNQALISARNQVALSKNAFANQLGLDPSTLVSPQPQPIPALPSLDENALLHSAFSQRPEYLESDINLLKAGANIRLSKRNLEPYLDAGLTAAYTPSNEIEGQHKTTASVGLTFTYPLYDGGATRAAVDQAKSDQRVAYIQKDQFVKGIKAEVQQSIIAVRDANQRSAVVIATVTEAQEALRLANVRFKAGVGTQLDVNNAEAQLVQAESNEVNAEFDYLGALARLSLAIGTPQ